ncbi:hypothetical protein FDP41_008803 [Naegleria fowleri]|uniref:F-box domain-containing protein n=1 Tax=Naegleria fowleri TaxID=5763 RepID=A0A6A5BEM7_NAEFO|nr:uncharacterized protein FDP41_008803 [Naegleria fowleri]KAF0972951.1 hypothetical protein FDP41_008803 [Naegleria fowleri]CAG4715858.1 unnamed protein product [Naegleria fowleri]
MNEQKGTSNAHHLHDLSLLNHNHPNLNRIDFLSLNDSQPLQELCKGKNDLKFFRAHLDFTKAKDLSKFFIKFQHITTLILGRCYLDNECLKSISLLPKVIDLDISENVFDAEGVKHLCGMSSLERINMDSCQHLNDKALQYISQGTFNRLSYLSLYHTPITDQGLKFISMSHSLLSLSLLLFTLYKDWFSRAFSCVIEFEKFEMSLFQRDSFEMDAIHGHPIACFSQKGHHFIKLFRL